MTLTADAKPLARGLGLAGDCDQLVSCRWLEVIALPGNRRAMRKVRGPVPPQGAARDRCRDRREIDAAACTGSKVEARRQRIETFEEENRVAACLRRQAACTVYADRLEQCSAPIHGLVLKHQRNVDPVSIDEAAQTCLEGVPLIGLCPRDHRVQEGGGREGARRLIRPIGEEDGPRMKLLQRQEPLVEVGNVGL